MNGVTTAIVLFCFICLALPGLVKNRTQYYAALAAALAIIFLDGLAHVINTTAFSAFAYSACALLQIIAVGMLVMSAGGLSPGQLHEEVSRAFEVLRRGEDRTDVIVPLSEEMRQRARSAVSPSSPRAGAQRGSVELDDDAGDAPQPVIVTPVAPGGDVWPRAAAPADRDPKGPLPLV